MCPCRAFYDSFLFTPASYLGFYTFWDIWVLMDPTFPAKNKTKNICKRLGRGTLNTCAKIQGLCLKNDVDIWTLMR